MPKQQAKRSQQPPVKAAFLSCRTAKTRCDGKHPCSRCSSKESTCSYLPSQRGGIRRGPYFLTQDNVTSLPATQTNPLFHQMSYDSQQWSPITDLQTSDTNDSLRYHGVDGILGLLNPYVGIRNLDIPFTASRSHLSQNLTNGDYTENLKSLHNDSSPQLRIYTSEQDIMNAYYIYIYPFLPILPPQRSPLYQDGPTAINALSLNESVIDRSCFSYWPASSRTLAISAILALISLPGDTNPFSNPSIHLRRSHAHLYAEAAFSEVDNEIDGISATCFHLRTDSSMATDSCVQSQLSPIIALVLLSIYEYCQRGNISRMRSRANQTVTAAMDLSLHNLGSRATEAQRHTWWSASPIISLNDPRITTPFPELGNTPEPWNLLLEAEKSILAISEVSDKHQTNNVLTSCDMSQSIKEKNSHLSDLIKKLDRLPEARIRLHRARAFRDIPVSLEKYCDLTAIQDKTEAIAEPDLSNAENFDATFPFTEQESSVMCLKSSLVIARALEDLSLRSSSPPCILPYFVCAAMQSAYVLLTSYYRIRAALESGHLLLYHYLLNFPEPDSETQDAERLIGELRQGMESIIGALKLAQMFEGVGGMSQEIFIAYQTAILTD
ncbi:uncharacterized protein N7483_003361 [Penicillium malachiteum]|uniref:uncharacterized protein n=1 Tax=Penicillium malachiteum TaxID=1324776 RepID=UPI00254784B9|nr:uncharacterized protein N7483_003361 [Penicillium malachiteum]KAJ5728853.1 hypothetical protein N7483_003361 [Penicillium malachiteum]